MAELPPIIRSLEDIAPRYSALLCDVWGVVHNGVHAFPDAASALALAREKGLAVVPITNAPRPNPEIVRQLQSLGVPDGAWDAVVTSGDVTRDLIAAGPRRLLHLGPGRDLAIYDGLDVDLVDEFEASGVVCTGLVEDEVETPEDYAEYVRRFRARDLPFICANPDIVVERGDRVIRVRRRARPRLFAARRTLADCRQAASPHLRGGAEGCGQRAGARRGRQRDAGDRRRHADRRQGGR